MLSFISGLIGLVSALVKYAQQNGLLSAGAALNAVKSMEAANAEIARAKEARLEQRAANDRDIADDGRMSDDKFKRSDDE